MAVRTKQATPQPRKLHMAELDPESINTGIMAERLKNLDATINRLEKRLFGNGSPGELSKHEDRIASLEKGYWRMQGIGITINAIVLIVIEVIAKYYK